jgi:formylglycine-generating enzyme required for sulfatase activity
MASVITLTGIDQALSHLKHTNKMTLKYRFVKYIRDYYVDDDSLIALKKIDPAELIKLLWDSDDDPEVIKNKRKNLTSLRSSVNADLKKLYENGLNPEGIKIGPDNIFVMSEDAKDKILDKFGYELQPDGTLKLDQIMDILKLANETISGTMGVEDTTSKDGLSKKDQLKDLIKRLSEKLGLGNPEFSTAGEDPENQPSGIRVSADENGNTVDIGAVDENEVLFKVQDDEDVEVVEEVGDIIEDEVLDDTKLDTFDEITELDDLDETEIIGEVDLSDDASEEILDDVEDVVTDDIEDLDTEAVFEEEEIDELLENAAGDEDSESEYTDVDEGDGLDDGMAGVPADEFGDGGNENEPEQLGLPVDSLGQEYGSETETKLKKDKLLAEAFDGYLGSMDRYYNHYILIDGGRYLIGSRQPKRAEEPEQMITLEPFYFGRFPVTNGLFEIFVEKTGYKTTAERVGYGTVYYGRFEKKKDDQTGLITSIWNSSLYCREVEGACWYRPSGPDSTIHNKRNHPVVQISLEDAVAFASWTGKRLPTESEWEAASRTANGWTFPWGHEWKDDAANIEDSGIADTTPVDKYAEFENDFGTVDVLGNVLEWTDNGFEAMSQEKDASTYRIAKGGSWVSANDIRLFSRFKLEPDSHSNILGFRCVAY